MWGVCSSVTHETNIIRFLCWCFLRLFLTRVHLALCLLSAYSKTQGGVAIVWTLFNSLPTDYFASSVWTCIIVVIAASNFKLIPQSPLWLNRSLTRAKLSDTECGSAKETVVF